MGEDIVAFVATKLIPAGLMLIMFSLGMSLTPADFGRLAARPKSAFAGLGGQLLLLPALGWVLAILFDLPPALALSVIILAACPGGVTSNAVVFTAKGDVALSVTLTALSSTITIFTTPLLVAAGIEYFYQDAMPPVMNVWDILKKLFMLSLLPLSFGMVARAMKEDVTVKLVRYLRPTSFVILVLVIVFSLFTSLDLIFENIVTAGPVVFLLNILSLGAGYYLGSILDLTNKERMTIGIEVGVQNATVATFLSLAVLGTWELAIIPTMYGCFMLINAGLFVRLLKAKAVQSV
ncbi:MAG: bile acid:sodium symporter family protein [Kordiimonas sp.]